MTAVVPGPDYPTDAWHRLYDRSVWAMGEDGSGGVLVQGHDRRSYAALNAWCRHEGVPRPGEKLPNGKIEQAVSGWATFVDSCGCTDGAHAAHRQRIDPDDPDVDPVADCCEDITAQPRCSWLPPCTDEMFSWMSVMHPDQAERPVEAVPVLTWQW